MLVRQSEGACSILTRRYEATSGVLLGRTHGCKCVRGTLPRQQADAAAASPVWRPVVFFVFLCRTRVFLPVSQHGHPLDRPWLVSPSVRGTCRCQAILCTDGGAREHNLPWEKTGGRKVVGKKAGPVQVTTNAEEERLQLPAASLETGMCPRHDHSCPRQALSLSGFHVKSAGSSPPAPTPSMPGKASW
ncbi:hypothetical protein TGDOM2_399230 [Toxoplasma gondii GAB2-2007-GAL-DOM2]|uniref:Uncharacterized protein n=1 Tax=Toxoplasma gondii GAB2-2007-GAL-DOM2 TaxID=1130820 RepID=A0A086K9W7_TOXGO|nr:hypothetical protein TGDOM2_399230 [Toxoplasma gondii GAB2-2007-GAL-DOM2]